MCFKFWNTLFKIFKKRAICALPFGSPMHIILLHPSDLNIVFSLTTNTYLYTNISKHLLVMGRSSKNQEIAYSTRSLHVRARHEQNKNSPWCPRLKAKRVRVAGAARIAHALPWLIRSRLHLSGRFASVRPPLSKLNRNLNTLKTEIAPYPFITYLRKGMELSHPLMCLGLG
jgi:hypothetical protein